MKSGDITIGRKLSPEDYEFGVSIRHQQDTRARGGRHAPGDGAVAAGGASEAVVNRREEKEHETGKCPFPGLAQGPSMEAFRTRNLPE
ncbi:unnamed protein product [Spirodela intermedia]|uniref:Uncharacterized protein n=1 Tax=Spirodela intermedia TaxID=51605 RepID=A0A7I8KXL1_SPIIN|nr:unnamed protein product [Spirodela intermedia]